jgi:hypothetical protein
MGYFELVIGLSMLTASAILLAAYVVPKLDPGASRSMPHMATALAAAALLWCAGAKIMTWSLFISN